MSISHEMATGLLDAIGFNVVARTPKHHPGVYYPDHIIKYHTFRLGLCICTERMKFPRSIISDSSNAYRKGSMYLHNIMDWVKNNY